jgi:hypothetical protein
VRVFGREIGFWGETSYTRIFRGQLDSSRGDMRDPSSGAAEGQMGEVRLALSYSPKRLASWQLRREGKKKQENKQETFYVQKTSKTSINPS